MAVLVCVLLALLLVPGFSGGLGRLPPGAVVRVPVDGLFQTGLEIRVRGRPAQFGPELRGIDRVTAVVARTVPHPVERVFRLSHHPQDHAQHGDVVLLAVGADQVRLADAALRENRPHARAVVLGVDPVAHVLAPAVQLRTLPVQNVRDLARDELLHMLVRAVIIRAVRDRGADAVRTRPRAHQHVRCRLRGAVRGARMVRGGFGEPGRIVQGKVAVHLVRAHVMVADAVPAHGLQQAERALHIRPEERLRIRDGVVVVALGRVVHDRVVARHDTVQQVRIADVAHHQLHTVLGQTRDVLRVARVREFVQHGHVHVRVTVHHVVHEVRPDEAAATGHDDVMGSKKVFSHATDSTACTTPFLDGFHFSMSKPRRCFAHASIGFQKITCTLYTK